MQKIDRGPLYPDFTPVISPPEICERVAKISSTTKLGLVVVDYFQLLDGRRSTLRWWKGAGSSKRMAIERNVPVDLVSKLNRKFDACPSKRPALSDLRGAGAIKEVADAALFLYRNEVYSPGTEYCDMTEIIVVNQKNCPTGFLKVKRIPEHLTFIELCTR